ncbi:MarR family winged helix-turn-helix transcriptional regulator [Pararhizobium sp. IMCC21322]|uniref:MarR family winged helix-turn-helix transcriptional regulator n=1 Tax=Pararhizobium sp. IMCC21322 TaxID=3067903 RepID=UPI002742883A|nr:MarR family transcriptional regulator [Pararhizobium sp. IMCC21322]
MANKKLNPPRSMGRQLNYTAGACNAVCQKILERYDLSLPQWVILSAVWKNSGLTLGDLAAYSGNNAPATSRIVDRMVDKGFLLRTPDAHDRRTVRIDATSAAKDLSHLANFYEDINAVLLDGFSKTETDMLFSLLERAEQNAKGWNKAD